MTKGFRISGIGLSPKNVCCCDPNKTPGSLARRIAMRCRVVFRVYLDTESGLFSGRIALEGSWDRVSQAIGAVHWVRSDHTYSYLM